MTSRDFCYWLQGYLEIGGSENAKNGMTAAQVECVSRHLAMVFKHEIDPSMGPPKHQEQLNKLHQQQQRPDPNQVFRC